jgi:hypothetical protein
MTTARFLVHKSTKKPPGSKAAKERVTLVVTGFADGSRAPLGLIGRAARPRVGNPSSRAPLMYYSSPTAWMTSSIYSRFIKHLVAWRRARATGAPQRLFLQVDNCGAHCCPPRYVPVRLSAQADDGSAVHIDAFRRAFAAKAGRPPLDAYLVHLPDAVGISQEPRRRDGGG